MKFFCLNGMPRSGSTLLANILNQNPAIRATPTSGLCELLLQVNHHWNNSPELRASATYETRLNTLRGIMGGFHFDDSEFRKDIIIDKSRGWVCAFELLKNILKHEPKILVTYRDIPSILSSCEKLFRRELADPKSIARWGKNMETIEGRLAFWTAPDQLVGGAYNRIRDCVMRGHRANMHFIGFEDLTIWPEETMKRVYEFLGLPYFEGHDFTNVAQTTHEKDSEHGFVDLHTIRPKVEKVQPDWKEVLGDAARPYMNFRYDFI